MKYVICNACGWIHFAKSESSIREHAQLAKTYFESLPECEQEKSGYKEFSVESAVEKQKRCFRCGSVDIREAKENERPPELSTIQSIIFDK